MLLTLHPQDGPRPTPSRGERLFWKALKDHLPPGWAAWHSLRIRTPRGLEGESDFVLWVPGRGVILMEVKGGQLACNDGKWTQNGRSMFKPPLDQARSYMNKLIAVMRKRHPEASCEFVTALCFPETAFSSQPGGSYLRGRVLGAQDLGSLGGALRKLAAEVFPRDARSIHGDVPAALHDLWGETWAPRLCLGDRIAHRQKALVPLDEQQLLVLDMMADNDRVLFRGGAGTGKTLLATERARRMMERGKRPLYLCSTTSLARKMRQLHDFPIYTVRQLAADALKAGGVELQEGSPREEWTPETWSLAPRRAAVEVAAKLRELHDGLIVDEAQDLSESDWELVRALGEGMPIWAFHDPGQAFWPDRQVPSGLFTTKARLPRRYRCPEALAGFADQYVEADGVTSGNEVPDPAALADVLSVVTVEEGKSLEEFLALLLAKSLEDGTQANQIAVLSLGGQTQSKLCHLDKIGPYEVRRGDADDAAEHIISDTFLRFKGLERPIVFIAELDRAKTQYAVRMHMALTRAQVQAVVVVTEADLLRDEHLRAVQAES